MPEQFLPVCPADIRARGWDAPDFVYVTGDAYEGAQTASLTIKSFQTGQTDGAFWCVVTDGSGSTDKSGEFAVSAAGGD